MMKIPPIIDIDGILVSSDILTECFCCDLDACKGICCVEGDAGAPAVIHTDTVLGQAFLTLAQAVVTVTNRRNRELPKTKIVHTKK